MKYYIIAGEASGDLHGAGLIRGLKKQDPHCEIRFRGGEKMAAEGGTMALDYRQNAVMGIVEVVSRLGSILKDIRLCKKDITAFNPDAVILIDYPGFNLKIAKFAHNQGYKVFYYIPPKVWARGEKRIEKLRRYTDGVFIIFPFEVPYFQSKGLQVHYQGNPLVDYIAASPSASMDRAAFMQKHSLQDDGREIVALLAGSRKMEVNYLLPRMKATVALLRERCGDRFRFLLAAAPSINRSLYTRLLADSGIELIEQDTYGVLHHARAAIISSGTASLEAAIMGTPQVVCYGFNPVTYAIAKLIVKLDTISLANMILGHRIFRELIQYDCIPENIAQEVLRLTEDGEYRTEMLADYSQMRSLLGEKGSAERTAAKMEELLKPSSLL